MRTYPQSKSPQNCNEKIPLLREGKHQKREDKTMIKRRVKAGRGYDVYAVENFHGLTDNEIADKCDFNNWGFEVLERYPENMLIKIYTD